MFEKSEVSGQLLEQVILIQDPDLVIGQLQFHVQLRIAGIQHIRNQCESVDISLPDNVKVFVSQLYTFFLCAQTDLRLIQIDVGFIDGVAGFFYGQFASLFHFQGRQPFLFKFLSVLEQRIQIVGNANSRIPVAEVVVQGRHFDQDRSVEIIGGVQADAWPFLGKEKINPVLFLLNLYVGQYA